MSRRKEGQESGMNRSKSTDRFVKLEKGAGFDLIRRKARTGVRVAG